MKDCIVFKHAMLFQRKLESILIMFFQLRYLLILAALTCSNCSLNLTTTHKVTSNKFSRWNEIGGITPEMISCCGHHLGIDEPGRSELFDNNRRFSLIKVRKNGTQITVDPFDQAIPFQSTDSAPFRMDAMKAGIDAAVSYAKEKYKVRYLSF